MPEKLVRDRVPSLMDRKGTPGRFRRAEPAEVLKLLCAKLVEEAQELQQASDISQRYEEFGDVLEVLQAIVKTPEFGGIRFFELDGIRESKLHTHGGFTERWVLITSDAPTSGTTA